jgi:hypothetical protein
MPSPVQSAPPVAPQAQVIPAAPGPTIGLYAYPLQQQDAFTQKGDERYCWQWSRAQTGIDPLAGPPPAGAPPPPSPPAAGAARGAAWGAAGGAAIGAIAGSAGKGAAIGSVVGAAQGHRSTQQANAAAQQQAQLQQQAAQSQTDQFRQAYASCLVGRGYSVQ